MSARTRRTSDPRAGLYLTLGAALIAPAGATALAVTLAGCQDAPPERSPEQSVPLTGVETVIRQLPDGSYQIADEQVVEGRQGGVTIIHTDASAPGGTRTERLDSPEAFAARLPATPPDSTGLAGGGGNWNENGNNNGDQVRAAPMGYGLGNVLLMSALFSMWRPPFYSGYGYNAPNRAYANSAVRQRSQGAVRSGVAAAQRRGTLATPTRVAQRASATRAARPSGGRSGAFSRGIGGSGGG